MDKREKICVAKALLELQLASTVDDNTESSFKYGNSKRRTKEITLVHYLMRIVTSQIGTQTKHRHLMPSSPQNTNDGPWNPQSPKLEDHTCVNDTLPANPNLFGICCSTRMHIALWDPKGFIPGYTEDGRCHCETSLNYFFNSLGNLERPQSTGSLQTLR